MSIKLSEISAALYNVKEVNNFCHKLSTVATPAITAAHGIDCLSWTFSEVQVYLSEPLAKTYLALASLTLVLVVVLQNGKALCDRYISVSKAKIIDYVNSGGNARDDSKLPNEYLST